jgi:hypothetical protein
LRSAKLSKEYPSLSLVRSISPENQGRATSSP